MTNSTYGGDNGELSPCCKEVVKELLENVVVFFAVIGGASAKTNGELST
jgi:hypothetical protein